MRRIAQVVLGLILVMSACGEPVAEAPPGQYFSDPVHGLAVSLPPAWQRATTSLTPGLGDPREVLTAGTFALRYRETRCGQLPTSALEDLGPRDALLTLEERGLDPGSSWSGFPPRPARFGPELGGSSEAAACAPGARFTDHWFGFSDGDRHFHVLVAFGPDASAAVQREAWGILDSLKIDPRVRPDWHSTP